MRRCINKNVLDELLVATEERHDVSSRRGGVVAVLDAADAEDLSGDEASKYVLVGFITVTRFMYYLSI